MSDPTYNGPPGADPAPGASGQPPPPPPPPGGYQQQQPPGGYQQQQPPGGYQQQQPPGGYQQQAPQGAYQQQGGYQPAPPAYGAAPSKVGQPAELLDRFLARLIDYVILFIINMIVVGFLIIGVIMQSQAGVMGMGGGGNFLTNVVSSVLLTAIYLGYFAFMESSRGQTVGKMLMKLQTRGPDGGNPTMEQAIRRNIWVAMGILGVIPIIGGILGGLGQLIAVILIAVGINSDTVGRRGWHDTFAGGTQVVKIG